MLNESGRASSLSGVVELDSGEFLLWYLLVQPDHQPLRLGEVLEGLIGDVPREVLSEDRTQGWVTLGQPVPESALPEEMPARWLEHGVTRPGGSSTTIDDCHLTVGGRVYPKHVSLLPPTFAHQLAVRPARTRGCRVAVSETLAPLTGPCCHVVVLLPGADGFDELTSWADDLEEDPSPSIGGRYFALAASDGTAGRYEVHVNVSGNRWRTDGR